MGIKELKAEFEKLKYIEEKLEYLNFDEHLGCYVEKNNGMPVGLAAWVNGAFYGFEQAAKAQAAPEGFEIGRLQDRIVELLDERQELYAQLDRTEEDTKRINFLADKNQWIANVQLPREIVERNLSSLRNAIDRAMDLAAQEPTND